MGHQVPKICKHIGFMHNYRVSLKLKQFVDVPYLNKSDSFLLTLSLHFQLIGGGMYSQVAEHFKELLKLKTSVFAYTSSWLI